MQNSNECKRNFVAVYDGSSSVEDLKAKFCSTVANDVMLRTGLGVIRMWADEGSRNSRFQMLFTSFQERKTLINASSFQFAQWYKSQNLLIFSSCRAVTEIYCQTSYINIQPVFIPSILSEQYFLMQQTDHKIQNQQKRYKWSHPVI